ncbi:MAG: ribonuclease II [Betaproteobacteria bacterium RIFCSPLOWO2_12_FULL_64_23]|nr:MAG: ribonuclease II [Betaproteobacteria bacterium RIFCSPLOWO2_12_FULL_64_23]
MNVLYEETGSFKVGAVLAESDTSLQVEAAHGKRSKIKAASVLLRFEAPPLAELMGKAETLAAEIDTDFLWQCCGAAEFGFADLAREYCGHAPNALEAAAILIKLQSAPMYFYRKGKGRFRAAPADTLKAALASVEKKRMQETQIRSWADELQRGTVPEALRAVLPQLLYRPDRNRIEAKALDLACEASGLSAAKLFERAGALPSSHDYHLGAFLFEHFACDGDFSEDISVGEPPELPLATVAAFSLDDASTTEIDDAFSLTRLANGRYRVGIHIAAPGLGFAPGSALDKIARARLSTTYIPGRKITMLPPPLIERYTLAEGRNCPVVSLYLDINPLSHLVEGQETRIERVHIAANLRHHQVEALDAAFLAGEERGELPFEAELFFLWRLALELEAARGKPATQQDRIDYNFYVENERVSIVERRRGAPLDKLVAELMISANNNWGRLLADRGVPAIYRTQSDGKVRMTTVASPHQGLGVSHYVWASSPLRRYIDLLNQWQLLACLSGAAPPFAKNSADLLAAMREFELAYAAYDQFQSKMEHYWCLRWLLQEQVTLSKAQVLRDNLVKFEGIPLYVRVPSLPDLEMGSRVLLEIEGIDLIDNSVKARYKGPAES